MKKDERGKMIFKGKKRMCFLEVGTIFKVGLEKKLSKRSFQHCSE